MKRRGTREWAATLAICLLAGVAVNIAVAWTAGAFGGPDWAGQYDIPGRAWPAEPPPGWPEPDYFSRDQTLGLTMFGASHNIDELARTRRPSVVVHTMVVHCYGLPMRSMQARRLLIQQGMTITPVDVGVYLGGLDAPRWTNPNGYAFRRIAFEPLWGGFLVNSALCSALVLGIWEGARSARTRSRTRRGLCPACAYNLRSLPRGSSCPECGQAAGAKP